MGPRVPPIHAKGAVTIVKDNPSKLTTTRRLGHHNRDMAMFREGSHVKKLLHCNVPGVGLRGGVVSHELGLVRRRNIGFIAGVGINISVATRRLLGSCSHILLYYKTSRPESVGIPKESTGKVCFTISFLGRMAGDLLSASFTGFPCRLTGNGGILIVNNNSANGSYIKASVHLKTGSMARLRVVPRPPTTEAPSGP